MISQAELLNRIQSLPTLSLTVARLAALLRDVNTTANDIEKVLTPDPALTGNILKIVNTAYFAPRREVTSVRQAIVLMGHENLFEAAASSAFHGILPDRLPGYDLDAASFWQHSVAVAVLGQNLARDLSREATGLIFTAGLLHDLGKLAICSFLLEAPEEIALYLAEEGNDFAGAERWALGMDHAEVGGKLAETWQLPETIACAARWHHQPDAAPSDVDHSLVDIVHVADCLAHTLGFGADVGGLARRVESGVTDRLGIQSQDLENLTATAMEQILEMGRVFRPQAVA
ncbi:MAG: HDOD domain-containing protein [bacterium]